MDKGIFFLFVSVFSVRGRGREERLFFLCGSLEMEEEVEIGEERWDVWMEGERRGKRKKKKKKKD
jgi:hypothetical protein